MNGLREDRCKTFSACGPPGGQCDQNLNDVVKVFLLLLGRPPTFPARELSRSFGLLGLKFSTCNEPKRIHSITHVAVVLPHVVDKRLVHVLAVLRSRRPL